MKKGAVYARANKVRLALSFSCTEPFADLLNMVGHPDCGATYAYCNRYSIVHLPTQRISDGGSADPETNATLAAVIKRVKSQGVPKDNIESALKRVRNILRISDAY